MEIIELMKERHSVRQYTDKKIEKEKREVLNALIAKINQKAGLHIQIIYDEPKCFNSMMAHYGKFDGVNNYIALVGEKSKSDESLGYYGEQIVLKAQELGLNTCWVAMTHGKSKAQIDKGEKMVCLISSMAARISSSVTVLSITAFPIFFNRINLIVPASIFLSDFVSFKISCGSIFSTEIGR